MKKILIVLIIVVLAIIGGYFVAQNLSDEPNVDVDQIDTATSTDQIGDQDQNQDQDNDSQNENRTDGGQTIIGDSAGGNDITAYHFGSGDREVLLVGGIHGGYSWNTSLVAYEAIDYFEANPDVVPDEVMVTVIPVLNPDGLEKIIGKTGRFAASDVLASSLSAEEGRFNDNNVDLNRNFDCDWQASGIWQNKTVSGGSSAFSEPEARAIRNYIQTYNPEAVLVWYSAAGGVFASSCHSGVLPETLALTNLYADASGYPAYEEFDFYEITGDMVNWLAKEGVPAISVLLTNHQDTEWAKNRAGLEAMLNYYAQ